MREDVTAARGQVALCMFNESQVVKWTLTQRPERLPKLGADTAGAWSLVELMEMADVRCQLGSLPPWHPVVPQQSLMRRTHMVTADLQSVP